MSIVPHPSHFSRFGAASARATLPLTLRFVVNDFAPHFGQRTSPVASSTTVDFIPAPYDARRSPVPKMQHPDSKQLIEVSPAQVGMYESQGWQVKTPSAKKAAKKAAPASTKDEN